MNSIVSSSAATKPHHLLHQSTKCSRGRKKKQSAFYCYEIGKKGNKLNQIRTSKGSIQIWKFHLNLQLARQTLGYFLWICCHPLLPLLFFRFFTQILSILHVKGSLSAQNVGKTTVEKRSRMIAQIQNQKVNHCSTG